MECQIVEYSKTAAALAGLQGKYKGVVYDVSTKSGMAQAVAARGELKGLRTALEKERKRIKAPALERCQLIDSEARQITRELEALEIPIDDQIKAKEREEAARLEAEALAKKQAEEAAEKARLEEIARREAAVAAAEKAAREKIEAEEREARLRIEEAERAARMQREEADRAARIAREAEEKRLREEAEKIEAAAREQRRKDAERADGFQMLALFCERYKAVPEFTAIAAEISKFLQSKGA